MLKLAEYIWLDGAEPVKQLRSKARVIEFNPNQKPNLDFFPEWGFDGSSTSQAPGNDSDRILKPVNFVKDPIRGEGNFLVMCEVLYPDGTPHETNTRAILRKVLDSGADQQEPWFGFEQEYTLYDSATNQPLGWPEGGYPGPQGPYYCSVSAQTAFGRELVEAHTQACIEAGLMLFGINAEVMPGQWEFQIGYRDVKEDRLDPLNVCDHRFLALWLLYRLGEEFGIQPSIACKPVKGDWNGAGCHTNFSTKALRDPARGKQAIDKALKALEKKHWEHIQLYGHGLEDRLTGLHETAPIYEFRTGIADRGSSIRIPRSVGLKGYGYLEDRRPGANADSYLVAARILTTVLELDENLMFGTKADEKILKLKKTLVEV